MRIFKDVHVSGHASKEELRELIRILKPEYVIPCHGNLEMNIKFAELAKEEGYEFGKNLIIPSNKGHIKI
ncbi:MAG: MBL fold metallo-hydrolase RNA specificity domain-containing protein [Candidatus Altarchaeaceae archaeon]